MFIEVVSQRLHAAGPEPVTTPNHRDDDIAPPRPSGIAWRARTMLAGALCVFTMVVAPAPASADDLPIIQFDPPTKAFSSLLPYRAPFTLDVPAPKSAISVGVWFWEVKTGTSACDVRDRSALHLSGREQPMVGDAVEKHYQVTLPALHAKAGYCISIDVLKPWGAEERERVVSIVIESSVKLAATGSLRIDTLMSTITHALGADAEALVERPGTVTAKQAIREALWGTNKSPALATLQGAIGEYGNALSDLREPYSQILTDLDGASNPLAVSVTQVIGLLDAAKPDVGDGKLEPMVAVAASATAIALLSNKTKSVAERECSKILDPKTNPDCGVYTRILAIDPTTPPRPPRPVERLISTAKAFSSARTELATEFGLLLTGVLVVPSRPSEISASNPSYTDAASLYISGDVGITMPVFVNTSRSYGTDTILYVAASVSFVSVDKDVPLAKDGGFLRRFSIVGGFTLGQVMNSDGTITGVIGGKGLLLGAGLRVTDYVRLGAGTMILRQNDTGKLIPDTHVRLAPYLSLSIDLDVAGIVTGMFAKGAGLHL